MVIQFEENRIRQQQNEVSALLALCEYGNHVQKFEALKHLEAIAYPNKTYESISIKLYPTEIEVLPRAVYILRLSCF